MEIRFTAYTDSKYIDALIPIMQDSYKQLGIELVPELMEWNVSQNKIDKREFELCTGRWTGLGTDPNMLDLFGFAADVDGGYNFCGWRNEESEKLMQEGVKTTDTARRKEIYQKWIKVANEDLPYIFLNQSKDMCVVSYKVKNIRTSSFTDWSYDPYKIEIDASIK
jgi:peptide/nickel transport system substrate-binding protein